MRAVLLPSFVSSPRLFCETLLSASSCIPKESIKKASFALKFRQTWNTRNTFQGEEKASREHCKAASKPRHRGSLVVTCRVRTRNVPVRCRAHEEASGAAQPTTVKEHRQVDDVAHVVVPVYIRVTKHTAEVLVNCLYDDVWVTCKNGNEWAFGKQNPDLW